MSVDSKADSGSNTSQGSTKIYTRAGDKGKTSLIGGTRVSKSDARLETYGTIDELNSVIGVVISEIAQDLKSEVALVQFLQRLQSDLFDIGSHLACEDKDLRAKLPLIHEDHIAEFEAKMDEFSESLQPLKNFILPGGSKAAASAHVARTVCRRAERLCVTIAETQSDASGSSSDDWLIVRFINRLSDFLFVLARHLNRISGVEEVLWAPRKHS